MPKKTVTPADAVYERVRQVGLGFPGAEEKLSHGAPWFHVRGKMFLAFVDSHHGDGRLGVWCKASLQEQRALVASSAERFFVPPYVGVKGWVGVRLDHPETDWVELAILVENGWSSVVPPSVLRAAPAASKPRPPPPVRLTTDAKTARDALERFSAICLALPEATREREASHATYRVNKKVFAYFLDNHHGDGVIAGCVRVEKGENDRLVKSDPKRYAMPQYIGARGWVGVRLDHARVDWKGLTERVGVSYRAVAPKRLTPRAFVSAAHAARRRARPA